MKAIIVGGVAAGASAAARLRRLDESAEIIIVERGGFISFANCGLPYHLGGAIPDRDSLLVMKPAAFTARFDIDVRLNHEAVAIDREAKTLSIRRPGGGVERESYDKLLIATGSTPVAPRIAGADDPRISALWTIPDLDRIDRMLDDGARSAVIVGGGFIGLEVAENLRERGLEVTVVEVMDQVLPTLDAEMASPLAAELRMHGIRLELDRKVESFRGEDDSLVAVLDDGKTISADVAVLCVGVKPNAELAAASGLALGQHGHIVVDEFLRTSDPDIYAAGDVIEVNDPILGGPAAIPLAGPANRQGRAAADNMAGRSTRYPGSIGAAVVKVGDITAASVGHTERRLRRDGVEYLKTYLHPLSHAGYYPGAATLHLKLLFSPAGKILGAQLVGAKGVDKRLDVIATAVRAGLDVRDLADLELAYAPPYNSAKDPVNLAGMTAGNILTGDTVPVHADAMPEDAFILDVREPGEFDSGALPEAVNIPLGSLRERLDEIPSGKRVVVYCQAGFRGYVAERILRQRGIDAYNLSGGYATWRLFHPAQESVEQD